MDSFRGFWITCWSPSVDSVEVPFGRPGGHL